MKERNRKGFTLIELLIAIFIATLVLGAFLSVINYSLELQETNRNLVIATNSARQKIEEIRNTSFDSIIATYNDGPSRIFTPAGLDGRGRITASYVTGSNNNLIDVRIAICWRQKGGRIIGEDNGRTGGTALDGILNGGEDLNGNGLIDSPCVLSTAISRKTM